MPLSEVAFATTARLLLALARLEVAPETYRRLADAVPLVGRDALRHCDLVRYAPQWTSHASRLRYAYSRVVRTPSEVWHVEYVLQWWLYRHVYRENDLPTDETSDGAKQWRRQDGRRHRDNDFPAVVWANGTLWWCRNGRLHRDDDKPAVMCTDGTKKWFRNGEIHRDGDKPAIKYAGGLMEWWHDGLECSGEWLREMWRRRDWKPFDKDET